MQRVNPDNPKYEGCYYRISKKGIKTYYVKVKNKWIKVGREDHGITPTYTKNHRAALVNKAYADTVLPVKPKRGKEEKDKTFTVDQAWTSYYLPWAKNNLKPKTFIPQTGRYNKHIKPYIGQKKLDKVSSIIIENMKKEWNKAKLKQSSQQQVMLLISAFFNQLRKLDVYAGPRVMDNVKKINAKTRRNRVLTMESLDELLSEIGKENKIVWYQCNIIGRAGLRPDEVLRMKPIDIDLTRNKIKVWNVKSTTNQAKTREVPISKRLRPILTDMINTFNKKAGQRLFQSKFNYKAFYRAADKLGLNDGLEINDRENRVSPYTLRHTYATLMLEAGNSPKTVQKLLGHDRLESTMHYVHALDDSLNEAQNRLDEHWDRKIKDRLKEKLTVSKNP